MNEIERYEFDRRGYVVIENMLTAAQVDGPASAVDTLEEHAMARLDAPPRKRSPWGRDHQPTMDYVNDVIQGPESAGVEPRTTRPRRWRRVRAAASWPAVLLRLPRSGKWPRTPGRRQLPTRR